MAVQTFKKNSQNIKENLRLINANVNCHKNQKYFGIGKYFGNISALAFSINNKRSFFVNNNQFNEDVVKASFATRK